MYSNNLAKQTIITEKSPDELYFPGIIAAKEFVFSNLEDAGKLAIEIAKFCPFPKRVELGLNEIFINAIEHGNLGLHCNGESERFGQEVRFHKIKKMLEKPEFKDKCVRVHLQKNPTYILVTVVDEGKGFNYEKFTQKKVQRSTLPCGRGIYLAKFFSFDNLEYAGRGNVAKCYIHL